MQYSFFIHLYRHYKIIYNTILRVNIHKLRNANNAVSNTLLEYISTTEIYCKSQNFVDLSSYLISFTRGFVIFNKFYPMI